MSNFGFTYKSYRIKDYLKSNQLSMALDNQMKVLFNDKHFTASLLRQINLVKGHQNHQPKFIIFF